jgi:hypothetical protein
MGAYHDHGTVQPGERGDCEHKREHGGRAGDEYRWAVGMTMHAQADRYGSITTLDGNVVISLPYTFTFTATNGQPCCSITLAQVYVDLWDGTNLLGAGASQIVFGQSSSQSGTLVLDATGLSPGTHQFIIGAASEILCKGI